MWYNQKMTYPMWIMLISGFLLLAFFLLFGLEAKAGHRFLLTRARISADRKILAMQVRMSDKLGHVRSFNLRTVMHYVLHQFLGAVLFLNRLVERYINILRHHNRQIAKRAKSIGTDGHLGAIATHKENTALSEAEKTARMNHSLHN